jgi:hypothetical protein
MPAFKADSTNPSRPRSRIYCAQRYAHAVRYQEYRRGHRQTKSNRVSSDVIQSVFSIHPIRCIYADVLRQVICVRLPFEDDERAFGIAAQRPRCRSVIKPQQRGTASGVLRVGYHRPALLIVFDAVAGVRQLALACRSRFPS